MTRARLRRAQCSAAAKMTGVSKTSEKSEAKTAQTTAKKYDTLDLSENAVQYLAKTENENTSTESGTEDRPTTP